MRSAFISSNNGFNRHYMETFSGSKRSLDLAAAKSGVSSRPTRHFALFKSAYLQRLRPWALLLDEHAMGEPLVTRLPIRVQYKSIEFVRGTKMDFVAIDVETANADMASICQIGIATFEKGVLAGEWKTYVDPQDHFDGLNVSIHGIDAKVVAGSPTFSMLAGTLTDALNGRIVVTHTAFDKIAIYQAGAKFKASPPSCIWLDSACVVRRAWKEFSRSGYGLANICGSIGYSFNHHDALEDAKAAGNVLLAAMARTGLSLDAWLTRVRQPIDPEPRTANCQRGKSRWRALRRGPSVHWGTDDSQARGG